MITTNFTVYGRNLNEIQNSAKMISRRFFGDLEAHLPRCRWTSTTSGPPRGLASAVCSVRADRTDPARRSRRARTRRHVDRQEAHPMSGLVRAAGVLPSPTIHRCGLAIRDYEVVKLPKGSTPIHVAAGYFGAGTTQPMIELWYHVDLNQPQVARQFRIIGTGHIADVDPATHLGTVIHDLPGGRGVWHVFDLGEQP